MVTYVYVHIWYLYVYNEHYAWYKQMYGKCKGVCLYSCSYVPVMYISSLYKQESKPLGSIPLAENKVIRHPDDPKLPNQYRFEIISKLCLKYYMCLFLFT